MTHSLRETIREDGLRIITKSMPHIKRVHVSVTAGVGSAYDPPNYDGLAHFFEHMAFKGTKTRSVSEINAQIGNYFLHYNASTGVLDTIYWGEAVYTRFTELCSVLFDIYLNSVFPKDEIEKEKEVVCNEIARDEDHDGFKAYTTLAKMLWGGNPLNQSGVGTPEDIHRITRAVLKHAHKKWHVPSNTVVIGTGKINHDLFLEKVNAAFPLNGVKVRHQQWNDGADQPPIQQETIIERPERKKTTILVGCKVAPPCEHTHTVLHILNHMLGGGKKNSLLTVEIREKRGLAYAVSSNFDTDQHQLGYWFTFYIEVLPERINEAKEILYDVVCHHPLTKELFRQQQESLKDQWLVALEKPAQWDALIRNVVLNEDRKLSHLKHYSQKRIKMLSEITFEEVVALRNKLLTPERLAHVIVKPA